MSEVISWRNNNKKTALRYKLDLKIWACDLQPTWLSLPVPLKVEKIIKVNVRTFRYIYADHPSLLSQYLLQLLRRFLTSPAFIRPRSEQPLLMPHPPQPDSLTITSTPMLDQTTIFPSHYQVIDFPSQKPARKDSSPQKETHIPTYLNTSTSSPRADYSLTKSKPYTCAMGLAE